MIFCILSLDTDLWPTSLCFLFYRTIWKSIMLVLRQITFTIYLILSRETLEHKYVRFSFASQSIISYLQFRLLEQLCCFKLLLISFLFCTCHQARKFGWLKLSDTSDDSPNILVFQVCGYSVNN